MQLVVQLDLRQYRAAIRFQGCGVAFRQNGGQFIIADASQDKMLAADFIEHMRQRQQ